MENYELLELWACVAAVLHLAFEWAYRRMERAYAVVTIGGAWRGVAALRRNQRLMVGGEKLSVGAQAGGLIECPSISQINGQTGEVLLLGPGNHNLSSEEVPPCKAGHPNLMLCYWGSIAGLVLMVLLVVALKSEVVWDAVTVGTGLVVVMQIAWLLVAMLGKDRGLLAVRAGGKLLLRRVDQGCTVLVRAGSGWSTLGAGESAANTTARITWSECVGNSRPARQGCYPDLEADKAVYIPLGYGQMV
jgi:hypothetical protein